MSSGMPGLLGCHFDTSISEATAASTQHSCGDQYFLEASFHLLQSDCRRCFCHQIADPASRRFFSNFRSTVCFSTTRWHLRGGEMLMPWCITPVHTPSIYDICSRGYFLMGSLSARLCAYQTQLYSCRHHTTTPPFFSVGFQVRAPSYVLFHLLNSEKSPSKIHRFNRQEV